MAGTDISACTLSLAVVAESRRKQMLNCDWLLWLRYIPNFALYVSLKGVPKRMIRNDCWKIKN